MNALEIGKSSKNPNYQSNSHLFTFVWERHPSFPSRSPVYLWREKSRSKKTQQLE